MRKYLAENGTCYSELSETLFLKQMGGFDGGITDSSDAMVGDRSLES